MDRRPSWYDQRRMTTAPRLLVCDDAPGYQLLIRTVFAADGFDVGEVAGTWADAERLAGQLDPEAILLDLWLPTFDRDGVIRVRDAAPGAVLAVISSLAVEQVAELVDGVAGVDLVLSKRDDPEQLVRAVRAQLG
jgi:DNA-binding response OmpR family regulator